MSNPALLTDILEHPQDDAPRLAYADWLKKHGDADRAEFIRVQCKRADRDEYDATQAGLAKKEKSLLNKHGSRWQEEIPEWARKDPRFRRGFIARVSPRLADFLERGAELTGITPLEGLDLMMQEFDEAAVVALAECPHAARLTELNFWYTGLNNNGVKALAKSPYLTELRVLRLGPAVSDAGIKALAATKQLTALKTLQIDSHEFGMAALNALQTAPFRLESLALPLPPQGAAVLAGMSNLAALTHLYVASCGMDAEGAKALAASPYLTNLRVLHIGHNPLTAAGVAALAESPTFANLRELHIENSKLSDDAILALARSPHLAQIKLLVLVNNEGISEGTCAELKRRFGDAAKGYYATKG